MTVRIDHGHGYVEEFTDEQWAEIVQWSAELQQLMYGWMLRNPLTPPEVPPALAGPKHPSRNPQRQQFEFIGDGPLIVNAPMPPADAELASTVTMASGTPQCTCRTTFSSGTSGRTDGLTVLATAPGRQCVGCAGCGYCASLYLVES